MILIRTPARLLAAAAGLTALLFASCGGGSGVSSEPPEYTGPTNVIVFAARGPNGAPGLYVTAPDDVAPQLLTTEAHDIAFPRWSPDGTRLAYMVVQPASAQLRIVELATKTVVTVSESASASAASWSPDGKRLAFSDGRLLRIYDVGDAKLIGLGEIAATAVDWSPADAHVMAITSAGDLKMIDPEGGDSELLVKGADAIELGWSPDGTLLAYSTVGDGSELFVVQRGGEPFSFGPGLEAAWSPNGKELAYSQPTGAGSPVTDIYSVPIPGGTPRQLTTSVTRDEGPAYAPDGKSVAYVARPDLATAFLCIVALDTLGANCLALPQGIVPQAVAWSPH